MNLLLDTHTFLWCLFEDPKLGAAARQRIIDPASTVLLSVASVWEISIKAALGKLVLPAPLETTLPSAMEASQIRPLVITVEHALAVRLLPLFHRDPFDRLLVAQARVEGLTIVTADPLLSKYGVPTLDALK
jgi:PIN domain nuclease of toxin-antitoxin system